MTDRGISQAPLAPPPHFRRLPAASTFYLQASIIVIFFAGAVAPTPLYAVYQAQWGFTTIIITVIFAIYAIAVLSAFLTLGSLSDHVGRRPVLLSGIACYAAALVFFATAGGLAALLVARLLQGVAVGMVAAAAGAGLLDLDPAKGTLANAVTPITGTAAGVLLSGLLVEYLLARTHLVYWVFLALVLIPSLGVLVMPETAARTPGAFASVRPRFEMPANVRRPLLAAAPALLAAYALFGFYASLGPSLVRHLVGHSGSIVIDGLGLFLLGVTGALSVLAMRKISPSAQALVGTASLVIGVGITLLAVAIRSEAAIFAGAAVAGVGFGGGFQGSIRTILPIAAPEHRAGVLSVIYVISYLAASLPAIVAGVLIVDTGSLDGTATGYGIVVMTLAAAAFVGLAWRARVRAPVERCPYPCVG